MRLVVLIAVFLLFCGGFFIFYGDFAFMIAGRLALCLMFVFSGFIHLKYKEGIYLSYPDFLPQTTKVKLVFAIGDLQFAFAASLIFQDIAEIMVPLILVYLILGLFTQVNTCVKHISIKRGNYTGRGVAYLFFKIPEQLIIIGWSYYFILAY